MQNNRDQNQIEEILEGIPKKSAFDVLLFNKIDNSEEVAPDNAKDMQCLQCKQIPVEPLECIKCDVIACKNCLKLMEVKT